MNDVTCFIQLFTIILHAIHSVETTPDETQRRIRLIDEHSTDTPPVAPTTTPMPLASLATTIQPSLVVNSSMHCACTDSYAPVCGTDGVHTLTFMNQCVLACNAMNDSGMIARTIEQ